MSVIQQTLIDKITNPVFLMGGAGGFLLSMVTRFGYGFVDEYFDKRKVRREKRRELAKEIIVICTEGAGVGYNAMPGSQRHIQYIASQAAGLDRSIADDLRAYLGWWVACAAGQTPGPYENRNPSQGDVERCANLQKHAKSSEDSILERVRGWE